MFLLYLGVIWVGLAYFLLVGLLAR